MRFENTGPDVNADWMGRGFSEVITTGLSVAPAIYAIPRRTLHNADQSLGARPMNAPGISAERAAALVAGANRIAYGEYRVEGGRLHAYMSVEDPAANKIVATYTATGPASDVISAASALARQISPQAAAYGTRSSEALRQYVVAAEGRDPPAVEAAASSSIAADPNFGPPYTILAQLRLARQDRSGALAILDQARARRGAMSPAERARIDLEDAVLRGDSAARDRAALELSKATPAEPAVWSMLAQAAVAGQRYRQAEQYFQKAIAIQPDDISLLNTAAYTAAYAGDVSGAMALLRRYQALRPNEANPFDCMGDVNLYTGHYPEAENFYKQAQQKDPKFINGGALYKAAMARLMTGDIAGADAIAKQFIDTRQAAGDPLLEFRRAEWSWLSGRRQAAVERLAAYAQAPRPPQFQELTSRAWSQLTLWKLELGDRAGALAAAQSAGASATAGSAPLAAFARFVTLPPAPASEWAVRAERTFPDPAQNAVKTTSRAAALLFAKEFAAAAPVLRELYAAWNPSSPDPGAPVLLAWAYVETGRQREAVPLLQFTPITEATGLGAFSSLYFPRLFYLRGAVAQSQGQRNEARRNFDLFLKLSGGEPLIWGEEARARAAL